MTTWVVSFVWTVAASPDRASLAPASVALNVQSAEEKAKATIGRVCAECHAAERILQSRRTRTQWGEVLEEMIAQGAKVNDEDYDVITGWLIKNYGRVYVNLAPGDEMVAVLGVTEADAEKIVAYRKEHGKFADFDALLKVPSVSAEALNAARPAVAF